MDALLELSVAAEVAAPYPGPASGFELTAAALLSPDRSARSPDTTDPPRQSKPLSFPFPASPLTAAAEANLLSSPFFSAAAAPLSSFPPPPIPQRSLPELLQSSLEPGTATSGPASPIDKLSFWEGKDVKKEESLLNYSHLISPSESIGAKAKPNASLDLVATGRPSAFQVYKKGDSASESALSMPCANPGGGVRSKVAPQTWQPSSSSSSSSSSHWNPELPAFSPRIHGNQGPTFITPVAPSASPWDSRVRPASHWSKPLDTTPKLWAPPPAPRGPASHSRLHIEGKVLVLLRGAPGSGKSTLAWSV